jgi:hypothetical protein
MSKRQILTLVSLLAAISFLSAAIKAQTGLVDPRNTNYICVLNRTALFVENEKTIVLVAPCEAANVRQDRLTDSDYAVLEKMQAERILRAVLKKSPNPLEEARSTHADFLKLANEVCKRHTRIALLPLDWKAEQTRLSEITQAGGLALKTCGAL